ncbi:MAG: ferritin family protein [Pseudomonadota bacterium]
MFEHKHKLMPMLKVALEMEQKGKNFYEKAIADTTNPLGREIFGGLLGDELVHIDRIKSIYSVIESGKEWSDEWTTFKSDEKDLNSLFCELVKEHRHSIKADTNDIEAIDIGIDFEQKSVSFYEDHFKQATDPNEKMFLEKMVGEEKGHYELLVDMKFYLTDPAAWFEESEKISLDGA